METTLELTQTRRGAPALWESGGGMSNTGEATIIAESDGTPPQAIYVPRGGHLACGNHALIPIRTGMFVIRFTQHKRNIDVVDIYEIGEIVEDNGLFTATIARHWYYGWGEWAEYPPEFLNSAIAAAEEKAIEYHCRKPYYIRE